MAVVNGNYQLMLVDMGDIGDVGCGSDDGVFSVYNLGFATNKNKLSMPLQRKYLGFIKTCVMYLLVVKHSH